ncbi:hypothetical protein E2C01_035111 [Portunus trituberculatus]|uniref:Uncharacterized protein n=1 Tax=Portunus trituberculatus TaxID=210409 RepID=A0A5B7F895_PORTR|nr:hypothetical protein [Portunus trituberculatus]
MDKKVRDTSRWPTAGRLRQKVLSEAKRALSSVALLLQSFSSTNTTATTPHHNRPRISQSHECQQQHTTDSPVFVSSRSVLEAAAK